jgi:hypothetical protein
MRVLLSTIVLLFAQVVPAAAPSPLPANVKRACVLVRAQTDAAPGMPLGTATGTGFVVDKDLVLTCDHLTKIPLGYQVAPATSIAVETEPGKMVSAQVVRRDTDHDLALLKLSGTTDAEPFKIEKFCANRGEPVAIVGNFPEKLLVTRGELISKSIMDGFAMSTAKVRSGFSGGPVICSNGMVQGILSQRDDDNNSIFVRSDVILSLLTSYEKKCGYQLPCIERSNNDTAVIAANALASSNVSSSHEKHAVESKIPLLRFHDKDQAGHDSFDGDTADAAKRILPEKSSGPGSGGDLKSADSGSSILVAVPVRRATASYSGAK